MTVEVWCLQETISIETLWWWSRYSLAGGTSPRANTHSRRYQILRGARSLCWLRDLPEAIYPRSIPQNIYRQVLESYLLGTVRYDQHTFRGERVCHMLSMQPSLQSLEPAGVWPLSQCSPSLYLGYIPELGYRFRHARSAATGHLQVAHQASGEIRAHGDVHGWERVSLTSYYQLNRGRIAGLMILAVV